MIKSELKGKIYLCVLYICFCIIFSIIYIPKVDATNYVKYGNNSVLNVNNPGSWDSLQLYGPSVLYEDGIYKMFYSGSDGIKRQIGYATALTPFIFNRFQNNPLINWNIINNDDIGIEHPTVIKQEIYKLWFSNVLVNFNNFKLYYSSSNDGLIWNNPTLLIFNPPSLTWDLSGVGAPSVIFNAKQNLYELWYVARGSFNGSTRWRIGYATSVDGMTWDKHSTPVLVASQPWEGTEVGNPSVIFDEVSGIYEMFYHGDTSIGRATSTDGISWTKDPSNPILTPTSGTFDSQRVFNPYVLKKDGVYYMWYTGVNNEGKWQIGLATSVPVPTPLPTTLPTDTPTPTLTPTLTISPSPTASVTPTIIPNLTPTLSPTITPTPSANPSFSPIVIVPGLGASWNPKDIFSCDLNSSGKWELAPYVSLYNRLVKTLTENARLQLNQDVYLYTYDWRQPLDKQAENFKNYLDSILREKSAGTKFRLVGHSLGGLVIRSYLDHNPDTHHVLSVMTLGSPHMGTLAAYPVWEKGEINIDDLLLQITINQVITNCRVIRTFVLPQRSIPVYKFRTNREIVQYFIPVVKQLLPVFDYLRQDGRTKPVSQLKVQNDWIPSHPIPSDKYNIGFSTLSGENISTPRYFNVTKPSIREQAFGDWVDGKPTGNETTNLGDGTILNLSSQITGANNEILSGNHIDIITQESAISKILSFLDLSQIPVATVLTPTEEVAKDALTLSLDQNTKIKITDPKGKIQENSKGFIVTFNPETGIYHLEISVNKNSSATIYLSEIIRGKNPKNYTFPIIVYKDHAARFYLIYNPINSTEPFKLISL